MRRLTRAKVQKSNVTVVYVVCANDFPLSASLKKDVAEREMAKRKIIEADAIKAAMRQRMGPIDEIIYNVQAVPIIMEA